MSRAIKKKPQKIPNRFLYQKQPGGRNNVNEFSVAN